MKINILRTHMRVAYEYASLSSCKRKQVGCLFVKDDSIISIGYNGTAPGDDNTCEDSTGHTKPEVYHAENNAIGKLLRKTISAEGAYVFITCAPCLDCAKLILHAKPTAVYYAEEYVNSSGGGSGIPYLKKRNIPVHHLPCGDDE